MNKLNLYILPILLSFRLIYDIVGYLIQEARVIQILASADNNLEQSTMLEHGMDTIHKHDNRKLI